ncbi:MULTISPECIES: HGxxPAAW family protein [Streptomyces]|uniref:Uncharacterized protein n=2 Tax=Streptomyces TaxID=1883 RepID=A0A646KDF8_STRJU|nr:MULTISPECIES: HGxxPAAW family protein [Streptomyces]MQS34966.1 hypothetical protein [Streptomyces katsurahamanus]MQT00312.1 hypothetical protein [Streptomyces jumonjinensis]
MSASAHGHTPAAWTGVVIAFIGFCVSGVFMVAANPLGFWGGIVIVFVGGGVGMVMKGAGLGKPKESAAEVEAHRKATQAALDRAKATAV